MFGGIAEPGIDRHGAAEIEADVVLVGEADGAMQLDGLPADGVGGIAAARLGAACEHAELVGGRIGRCRHALRSDPGAIIVTR